MTTYKQKIKIYDIKSGLSLPINGLPFSEAFGQDVKKLKIYKIQKDIRVEKIFLTLENGVRHPLIHQ